MILHAKHPIARLLIRSEHKHLLHGGPILMMSSLCRRYHILRVRQTVRAITHECTVYRRWSVRPKPQSLRQLPIERMTPCFVFDKRLCRTDLHQIWSCTQANHCEDMCLCFCVSIS